MKANLEYIDRVLGYGGTCSSRRDARDRVEREREREREPLFLAAGNASVCAYASIYTREEMDDTRLNKRP